MLKVYLDSLGCAKNLVDGEMMLGILEKDGYEIVDSIEDGCDVVIVNTCAFIDIAKEESVNTILGYGELKKEGVIKYLVVTGCLPQLYKKELPELLPEVDCFLDAKEYHHIGNALDKFIGKESPIPMNLDFCYQNRKLLTSKNSAYLKISEGCSNNCTYCLIPTIRGQKHSRTIEELLTEAEILAAKGIKELVVISQDTTTYGVDLYGKNMLPTLLKELCKLPFTWVRFLYCYPSEVTDELLEVMVENPKICRYFDIPMQHISDSVLKRMGRRGSKENTCQLIDKIRKVLPESFIRTTFIVGFPGETDEEFNELLDFCREYKLDWVGAFAFSCQENTPAEKLPNQIDEETKENRREELMSMLSIISAENLEKEIGKELLILVEGKDEEEGMYFGRSYAQAPEVDGLVYFTSDNEIAEGEFVNVRITSSDVYDLIGEEI